MVDPLPEDWKRWYRYKKRTTNLIRNLLYLQNLEMLWNWTKTFTEHSEYTHFVVVRNDIYWVSDMPLRVFSDPFAVYTRPFGPLCTNDTRYDAPDDRVFILGSQVAEHIMTAYTAYFHNPNPELDDAAGNEQFFYKLGTLRGVRW